MPHLYFEPLPPLHYMPPKKMTQTMNMNMNMRDNESMNQTRKYTKFSRELSTLSLTRFLRNHLVQLLLFDTCLASLFVSILCPPS